MFEEWTEQDEALAESLVTEALSGWERMIPAPALQEMHEFLVDEYLCTSYGRRRLRLAGADPVVARSDEVARLVSVVVKKEGGGTA